MFWDLTWPHLTVGEYCGVLRVMGDRSKDILILCVPYKKTASILASQHLVCTGDPGNV